MSYVSVLDGSGAVCCATACSNASNDVTVTNIGVRISSVDISSVQVHSPAPVTRHQTAAPESAGEERTGSGCAPLL